MTRRAGGEYTDAEIDTLVAAQLRVAGDRAEFVATDLLAALPDEAARSTLYRNLGVLHRGGLLAYRLAKVPGVIRRVRHYRLTRRGRGATVATEEMLVVRRRLRWEESGKQADDDDHGDVTG